MQSDRQLIYLNKLPQSTAFNRCYVGAGCSGCQREWKDTLNLPSIMTRGLYYVFKTLT